MKENREGNRFTPLKSLSKSDRLLVIIICFCALAGNERSADEAAFQSTPEGAKEGSAVGVSDVNRAGAVCSGHILPVAQWQGRALLEPGSKPAVPA